MKLKKVNYKNSEERKGYLYRHIRLDTNEVFYIGIGIQHNKNYKRANEKQGRSNFWWNIVNRTNYSVEIVLENILYEQLLIKEKEFIKIYGRRDIEQGTLVNLTDGGEGALGSTSGRGRVCSEETKEKLRAYRASDETKRKLSIAGKGRPTSQKQKETASKLHKGRTWPERWKKVIQKTFDGDIVKIWNCRKEAESFGFTPKQISNVCRGETKSHKGFKWEYLPPDGLS